MKKQARARNNGNRRDSNAEANLTVGYDSACCGGTGEHGRFHPADSLIVDPPDGRIPPLTPDAQKRAAARAEARRLHPADGPEGELSLADRCIVRADAGPPMLAAGYNNNHQILQTPDYVVILIEMIVTTFADPSEGAPASARAGPPVAGRFARALGRRHAGRRHDEFHRQDQLQRVRRRGSRGPNASPASMKAPCSGLAVDDLATFYEAVVR